MYIPLTSEHPAKRPAQGYYRPYNRRLLFRSLFVKYTRQYNTRIIGTDTNFDGNWDTSSLN